MDQVLGQVLRNAVWERLDMLTDLANRADAQSLVSVARSELPRLDGGVARDAEDARARRARRLPDLLDPVAPLQGAVLGLAGRARTPGGRRAGPAAAVPADSRLQGRRKSPVPAQGPSPAPTAAETTGRHALVNPRRAVTA